jgi:16S rRNA G527 N7-methylase RsmG
MEQRIQKLEQWRLESDNRHGELTRKLDENTAVTKKVLDILTTGKMGASFIKWLVTIGSGIAIIISLFWHRQ